MPTILIVEDDQVLSGVLHTAFRREWTVEIAPSAQDALEVFREARPHVVLTDKNMPGMDGVALLRAIRQLDPTVGVVVMTAYGTVESASQAFALGVDAYVEKPFPDLLVLVDEMHRLYEKVEARRARSPVLRTGALRLCAACARPERRAQLGPWLESMALVRWVDSVEELVRVAHAGECDAALIDCAQPPIDAAQSAERLEAHRLPCVILAEELSVPEITRLIDLGVTALVNHPVDDPRFEPLLRQAFARIRAA